MDKIYRETNKCRICGNNNLRGVINLGSLALTGVFPKSINEEVPVAPLELVKCEEDSSGKNCGLLQLKHTFDLDKLYGDNYGYRSGLNPTMIKHLNTKVQEITTKVKLNKGDLIIDIGSNDCTLLKAYPNNKGLELVGIDPTGSKFKEYYPDYITLIPDFFSARLIRDKFDGKKAKVVTSIAMFYDLEEPISFMKEIYDILDDDGVWVFEQSYMPTMLLNNSYDTICHEHLEYYRLKQIKWMTDKAGFKIIDVMFNDVNGGSFCIWVAKSKSSYKEKRELVSKILKEEEERGLHTFEPYANFLINVKKNRLEIQKMIESIRKQNKKILGYGASTKGNVILQYCNITNKDIPYIADVNKDKHNSYTPYTKIKIISEEEAKRLNPDYLFVLPWHFREFIISKEHNFLSKGGKLLFPLPNVEVVE